MNRQIQTLPQLLADRAERYEKIAVQLYKNVSGVFQPVSYAELNEYAANFAGGLKKNGVKRGDTVGLIADNRREWQIASMGIMMLGAADVPRGNDATVGDLRYILGFTACRIAVIETVSVLEKLLPERDALPELRTLIIMNPVSDEITEKCVAAGLTVLLFSDVLADGQEWCRQNPGMIDAERAAGTGEETATIIFTSGTTGDPKGIPLCHRNFLVQLPLLTERIPIAPADRAFCILPIWHSYQRTIEYLVLYSGGTLAYSKPVGSVMLADLAAVNPELLPSIPRVWENIYMAVNKKMRKSGAVTAALFKSFSGIARARFRCFTICKNWNRTFKRPLPFVCIFRYAAILPYLLLSPLYAIADAVMFRKIRAMLGSSFRLGISGGGALPAYIDIFFNAIGVRLVEGYGLTETAPIISVRDAKKYGCRTIGACLSCCDVVIVDESGRPVIPGQTGSLLVKGAQVMSGYYRRPDLTAKVMSRDGWFDTGDLAVKTWDEELIIRGRKKDTIVLRNGENIEPVPIEMRIMQSQYVSRAVVVGQDQNFLGALIIPEKDAVLRFAADRNIIAGSYGDLLRHPDIIACIRSEIESLVNARNGFKIYEKINRFLLLDIVFEIGRELSAKQDVMHYKISQLYKTEIERMFRC